MYGDINHNKKVGYAFIKVLLIKKVLNVSIGSNGGHSSGHGAQPRYNFDTWNNWREADGFLCRTNDDCKWLDQNLNCEGAEFEFSPAVSVFM